MKVRNVAAHLPDGERLVLPALGNKVIRRGEPFDAPADIAALLLEQRDAYEPVDKEAKDLLKAMDAAAAAADGAPEPTPTPAPVPAEPSNAEGAE